MTYFERARTPFLGGLHGEGNMYTGYLQEGREEWNGSLEKEYTPGSWKIEQWPQPSGAC